MGHEKKKFESGEGAQYISRATAMKRLQLTLKDFRRLCILKGIYPREPRNRKRAQKGAGGIRTLYHKKDIQFLMHEPIIWKFREIKVHARKVGRAKSVKEYGLMKKLRKSYPSMKLDHIVKERYPTFVDALRDLDDCLTLCFLFSTFPSLRYVPPEVSQLCRRLTVEFLHAIMANRALRKVFISIKGYYFQAEVRGQLVTWIQPHHFGYEPQSKDEVDFRIMATFVQFYTIMLGFVNFRLYHTLNLYYPPKFAHYTENSEKDMVDAESFVSERIAALNFPLSRTGGEPADEEDELQIDVFPSTDDPEKLEEAKVEAEKVRGLKTLFKGLKVFLGREVPREPLVFTLRCFGAEVSWDQHLFMGATFDVTDESVTHQIVDRPSLSQQYISRYYVQPQWVFDSVNARELLPVEKYFIGCVLPPHLSPFVDHTRDQYYVPPEATNEDAELAGKIDDAESESNEEIETGSEDDEEEKKDWENSSDEEEKEETSDESTSDEMTEERSKKRRHMKVSVGNVAVDDPLEKTRAERQEYRLREKMINKKHRNLYRSMMKGRKERLRDKYTLENKRAVLEDQKKASKRKKKLTISTLSNVPVIT